MSFEIYYLACADTITNIAGFLAVLSGAGSVVALLWLLACLSPVDERERDYSETATPNAKLTLAIMVGLFCACLTVRCLMPTSEGLRAATELVHKLHK